jgi:6-phosphogluconolactonase (cycloisomerase 2 family)
MSKKTLVAVLTAAILIISAVSVFAKSWDYQDYDRDDRGFVGAVYSMTNSSTDNEGLLTKAGSISTGGTGSGGGLDPLGSQGSLVLSIDNRWLLAVNAGSNEISVFRVLPKGLKFIDKVSSGGAFPVSLTVFHNLVYVLNAGMSPNITGFYLSHRGQLIPLDNSTRFLGSGGFAQVGFDPQGEMLVVTDRANNEILVYAVGRNGLPAMNPAISMSNGPVPFGFIFDERGHLLVAEAGSGSVSSYTILHDGTLKVISPSVTNGQSATCWIAGNKRGDVFTANTGSQTISFYNLMARNGKLALNNATAGVADKPIDLGITENGRLLYALDPGNGTVHMFQIKRDGGLTDLGAVAGGLSIFAQGIVAR